MSVAIISDTRLACVKRKVKLVGMRPIMFDRYAGDNDTKLAWHEKIYLVPGSRKLCLPSINVASFLSSHNTNSAPKRLRDARKFKRIANACLSFVDIEGLHDPAYIEFLRNGRPITVGDFSADRDEKSGIYLDRRVARLEKGIPNPKERPVLPLPWELEFYLTILPNEEIKEVEIKNLFEEGGISIGLGSYRGVFGKFTVAKWD